MKLRHFVLSTAMIAGLLIHSNFAKGEKFPVKNATELLTALHDAAVNLEDDTIRIAQGEYSGGFVYSSTNAFNLAIEGGWSSDFSTRTISASNTIVDGVDSSRVLGIVSGGGNITLEGVTLKNGNWNISSTGGGGLYVNTPGGDITIRQCSIDNNISGNAGGGGALLISAGGNVTLTGNIIDNNIVTGAGAGGGAYIQAGAGEVTLADNSLTGNRTGGLGGAVRISATGIVQITTNNIVDNIATSGGSGGIDVTGASTVTGGSVTVSGNDFHGNSSWLQYNGILHIQARDITVEDNHIAGNLLGFGLHMNNLSTANIWRINNNFIVDNAQGGGIRLDGSNYLDSISLINNVISANNYTRTDARGGGIDFNNARGAIALINNTISNNSTIGSGGGIKIISDRDDSVLDLHSNIIYNNSANIEANNVYIDNDGNNNLIYAPVILRNNDFDQNPASFFIKDPTFYTRIDPSNLNNANPLFLNVDQKNFHLQSDSPCINTGNNQAPAIPLLDLDGQPRIMGGGIDIGAYETPGTVLPIALFSAGPLSGSAPLAVTFQDQSFGNINSRLWDFGDGDSSTEQHPIHTYTEAGSYTVTLTVTGDEGSDIESKPAFINVSLHPPVASAGTDRAIAQKNFTFSGAQSSDPDGSIVAYQWHLVHRSETTYNQDATGATPTVSDLQSGFYDVTLTVTDNDGLTGSDSMVLAVSDPWDIGGDGQTGLEEAIHILRTLSGL